MICFVFSSCQRSVSLVPQWYIRFCGPVWPGCRLQADVPYRIQTLVSSCPRYGSAACHSIAVGRHLASFFAVFPLLSPLHLFSSCPPPPPLRNRRSCPVSFVPGEGVQGPSDPALLLHGQAAHVAVEAAQFCLADAGRSAAPARVDGEVHLDVACQGVIFCGGFISLGARGKPCAFGEAERLRAGR